MVGGIDGNTLTDWAVSSSDSEVDLSKISWIENNDSDNLTEHIIDEEFIRDFELVDFDNDGALDVVGFNMFYLRFNYFCMKLVMVWVIIV